MTLTVQDIDDALNCPQRIQILRSYTSGTISLGRFHAAWCANDLNSGQIPTPAPSYPSNPAGEVCTSATPGAAPLRPAGVGRVLRIAKARLANVSSVASGWAAGTCLVCDRLIQVGPLSTGAPFSGNTPALPRYQSGDGVELWITGQVGNSASGLTATYTNSDGVPGRTATFGVISGIRGDMVRGVLQDDDTGVLSVQATTGTGVAFDLVLAKTLTTVNLIPLEDADRDFQFLGLPQVENDACLWFPQLLSSNNIFGPIIGQIEIVDLPS